MVNFPIDSEDHFARFQFAWSSLQSHTTMQSQDFLYFPDLSRLTQNKNNDPYKMPIACAIE